MPSPSSESYQHVESNQSTEDNTDPEDYAEYALMKGRLRRNKESLDQR